MTPFMLDAYYLLSHNSWELGVKLVIQPLSPNIVIICDNFAWLIVFA